MPSEHPLSTLIEQSLRCERSGDMASALRLANQALELARAEGHAHRLARALVYAARYRFRLGQLELARDLSEQALDLAGQGAQADLAAQADALLNLGNIAVQSRSLSEAETCFRRASDLGHELGEHLIEFRALHNLASGVYFHRGQFDLSMAADAESIRIAKRYNLQEWVHFPLISYAMTCLEVNRLDLAREALEELKAVMLPGSAAEAYSFYIFGCLALEDGELSTAFELISRAVSLADAIGDPEVRAAMRLGMSRCHLAHGSPAAARSWAQDAGTIAGRVGLFHEQGRALLAGGQAARALGEHGQALQDFGEALDLLERYGVHFSAARAALLRASALPAGSPQAGGAWQDALRRIHLGDFSFLLEQERSLVMPVIGASLGQKNHPLAEVSASLLQRLQKTLPPALKVQALGGLQVRAGSRVAGEQALRQRRCGELLVLLLLSPGNSLTRDQVLDELCPEKEPGAALVFYHHAVSALRRLLEPDLPDRRFDCRYLDVDDERITLLLPPGSQTDFLDFEKYVRSQDWEKAVKAYRGEFLPLALYADWTISWRQHLADQFELALLSLAEIRLQEGDPAACLTMARQALLRNAWNERAVEMGMRAALELGDRSAALQLYRRLERTLDKELGLAPQPELQQMYAGLRRRFPHSKHFDPSIS